MWQMILIAYLMINVLGGMYEMIRDRKDIDSKVKETFEGSTNLSWDRRSERPFIYAFSWMVCYGVIFVIYVVIWAPFKLCFMDKGKRV